MVVGNGMLAKAFSHYEDNQQIILFASGVSNSKENNSAPFIREELLLREYAANADKKLLIYFSTCSIYDADQLASGYVQHKLKMEEIIQEHCENFLIFRLTNPIGLTENKKTVLNYLLTTIKDEMPLEVWTNASRNLMDIEDVVKTVDYILSENTFKNAVVDIANPANYTLPEIISSIEKHTRKVANQIKYDKGGSPKLDPSILLEIYKTLGIEFTPGYIENLLRKYF